MKFYNFLIGFSLLTVNYCSAQFSSVSIYSLEEFTRWRYEITFTTSDPVVNRPGDFEFRFHVSEDEFDRLENIIQKNLRDSTGELLETPFGITFNVNEKLTHFSSSEKASLSLILKRLQTAFTDPVIKGQVAIAADTFIDLYGLESERKKSDDVIVFKTDVSLSLHLYDEIIQCDEFQQFILCITNYSNRKIVLPWVFFTSSRNDTSGNIGFDLYKIIDGELVNMQDSVIDRLGPLSENTSLALPYGKTLYFPADLPFNFYRKKGVYKIRFFLRKGHFSFLRSNLYSGWYYFIVL